MTEATTCSDCGCAVNARESAEADVKVLAEALGEIAKGPDATPAFYQAIARGALRLYRGGDVGD